MSDTSAGERTARAVTGELDGITEATATLVAEAVENAASSEQSSSAAAELTAQAGEFTALLGRFTLDLRRAAPAGLPMRATAPGPAARA